VSERATELARSVADLARERGRTVATAESLTSGSVAAALGAAPGAASWFRGGLVAYHDEVKHGVLSVDDGPVVCDPAARQMAHGVATLLGAEVAVAATGAGGPEPQDGQEPGTVFVAVWSQGEVECREHHFEGEAEDVVRQSVEASLALLAEALDPDGGR
jgi:nicotinamide-nucleotide amidase